MQILKVYILLIMLAGATHASEFQVDNNTGTNFWLKIDFLWREVPAGTSVHFARAGSTAWFYQDQMDSTAMSIYRIRTSWAAEDYNFEWDKHPRFTLDYDGTNYFATVWNYDSPIFIFQKGFGIMCVWTILAMGLRWLNKAGDSGAQSDID